MISTAEQQKDFISGEIPSGVLSKGSYFHPLLDVPSALILIFGGVYFWFKTKAKFNILISVGAVIFTFTGFLPSVNLNSSIYFYSMHLIAIIVFFIGFLWSAEVISQHH